MHTVKMVFLYGFDQILYSMLRRQWTVVLESLIYRNNVNFIKTERKRDFAFVQKVSRTADGTNWSMVLFRQSTVWRHCCEMFPERNLRNTPKNTI